MVGRLFLAAMLAATMASAQRGGGGGGGGGRGGGGGMGAGGGMSDKRRSRFKLLAEVLTLSMDQAEDAEKKRTIVRNSMILKLILTGLLATALGVAQRGGGGGMGGGEGGTGGGGMGADGGMGNISMPRITNRIDVIAQSLKLDKDQKKNV